MRRMSGMLASYHFAKYLSRTLGLDRGSPPGYEKGTFRAHRPFPLRPALVRCLLPLSLRGRHELVARAV